jgi:hypothetical protein
MMGRRKQEYSEATFDHEGNFNLEWTIEDAEFDREQRGESKVAYVAPKDDQKWQARDLVDIHWMLTGIEIPSPSYNRVMSCIIRHANPTSGRCQLKQKLIAVETGYSVETIKRATKWWVSQKFIKVEPTGLGQSNAYHPQWDLFELHYVAIESEINAQKQAWLADATGASRWRHASGVPSEVIKGTHAEVIKGTYGECHHGDLHESQSRTSKDESHPERVVSYEPTILESQITGKDEGIQEGEVQSVSTNSPPPDSPTSEEKATDAVNGYLTTFDREHLTNEDFDLAVAAEMEVPGSGCAVVKAASQKSWRLKRKGGAR